MTANQGAGKMLSRRSFLVSCSAFSLLRANNASAVIPAIAGAIAALAALAVATGKAAEALEAAIDKGHRVWRKIKSIPAEDRAAQQIAEQKAYILDKMQARQEVIRLGNRSQHSNSVVVDGFYNYIRYPVEENWLAVRTLIVSASDTLIKASTTFRANAAWFPAEAQDELGKLPILYVERVKIMDKINSLPSTLPPPRDVEKLCKSYDSLRIQSLKLLAALDKYLEPSGKDG